MADRLLWLVLIVALGGCASTRFENYPLADGRVNAERRAVDLSNPERPLILVAVSGGGSRAAALGWVVLREMRKFSYSTGGAPRSLVDDIAVVSSVSGGSVISAHFVLWGPQGLDRFEPDFLVPDNTKSLMVEAANPLTWAKLAMTGTSRINLVEAMFDRELFRDKTFVELNQPDKPYLILNATDMASGEVFAFTPNRFNDICSDLDKQPISSGVAASAAVPILFSPVALKNYSGHGCASMPAPSWIANRLQGRFARYVNIEQYKLARYANDLRHGPGKDRAIDYLYLLDGGLADNLAIHGLLETISSPYAAPAIVDRTAPGGATTIISAINSGQVRKIVVVVVNARADPASGIYQSASRPGILDMIGAVAGIPIDSNTSSVSSQMQVLLDQLNAAGAGGVGNPRFKGLNVYGVEVDFDQLRTSDPLQRALREEANKIPTLWTISEANRDVLVQAGTTLLRQHPCFQRLLLDMSIAADFIDPAFARTGCRQATD